MGKLIQIVVVLIGISLAGGLVLGGVDGHTKPLIEKNILKFKKIPAVVNIYEGIAGKIEKAKKEEISNEFLTTNMPIKVEVGDEEKLNVFIIKHEGKPVIAAFEREGEGAYKDDIGVMVGFDLATGDLAGIGITTENETPGLGKKIHEEAFRKQFKGMKTTGVFKIKKDGGPIDAVSGASKSSRAVADGVDKAIKLYESKAAEIKAAIEAPPAPSGDGS